MDTAKKAWNDAEKARDNLAYQPKSYTISGRQDYPDEEDNTPAGLTTELSFNNYGVYNFTIAYQSGNNTPIITTEFAMVFRRELPVFKTYNSLTYSSDSVSLKSENIKKDTLITIQPKYVSGQDVKSNVEFKQTNTTYVNGENTLPPFLDIRGFVSREESKDMPQIQIGRKIKSDGSLAPIVYGEYTVTFQLTYTGFDNVRSDGTLLRATDQNPSATMTIKLVFNKPGKKPMSSWVILLICAAILGGLGGAWYLSNKFALAVQAHDIKKQNEREIKARAQREANLEKMRKSVSHYEPAGGDKPELDA
jgi:hypothetical protein